MNTTALTIIIALLTAITIAFFLIARSAQRLQQTQEATETVAASRHRDSSGKIQEIHGNLTEIRGTIENQVLPKLTDFYQAIAAPKEITAELLVTTFKEAGIKAVKIADEIPAVGFGVDVAGTKISIFIQYQKDSDDLVFQSFAFSSATCLPELNQELLELNGRLMGGGVAIRNLNGRFVYLINHAISLASGRLSARLLESETYRLAQMQKHLEGILSKYKQPILVILLSEFIELSNRQYLELKKQPSVDDTKDSAVKSATE